MQPYPHQKDHLNIAQDVVNFITSINEFRDSTLETFPRITDIYQNPQLELNRKPTFWQAVVYSVPKFKENPLDIGRELLEVIFMATFNRYFSSKPINQILSQGPSETDEPIKSEFENIKKRDLIYQRSCNPGVYDEVMKILNVRNSSTIREWFKAHSDIIKQSSIGEIRKEDVQALVRIIKVQKDLRVVEYISSLNCYIEVIGYIVTKKATICPLRFPTIFKLEDFLQGSMTSQQYQKWHNIKRKTIAECHSLFYDSPLISNRKPLNFLSSCFLSIATQHQNYQMKSFTYLMHYAHVAAEKKHNNLLADMIRSKCFKCDAERFASSSIQKTRIYQCLSRKLLNVVKTDDNHRREHDFRKKLEEKKDIEQGIK